MDDDWGVNMQSHCSAKCVACLVVLFTLSACIRVRVDPVKIDATVTIRIEKELENFFDDLDSQSSMLLLDSEKQQKAQTPETDETTPKED
ncbi:MAG: hypothetical protein JW942_10295 [Opitutales bacterium]|nr:hypothetical protein [Opitutales bacterium]